MMTFRQYVLMREGLLLPDRPPRAGLPRINTTPFQNRRRTRTLGPRRVKSARMPTVQKVGVARVARVAVA
jgi:hypothetical protein